MDDLILEIRQITLSIQQLPQPTFQMRVFNCYLPKVGLLLGQLRAETGVVVFPAGQLGLVIVLEGHLILAQQDLDLALLILDGCGRFELHGFDETCPKAELLLQGAILSGKKLQLLLLLEIFLLKFGQLALAFVQFLLQSIIWQDGGVFFYELTASSLVLLFEGGLEVTELLVLGSKGISEHVQLALQLRDLLLVELFQTDHRIVDLLDLLVLAFDQLVELSLFGLEEFSSLLFLLRLADETLGGELHLGSQTSDLFLELQPCRCEFHLHVLYLRLLLGDLNLEVFSQLVILLEKSVEFVPIDALCLAEGVDFRVQSCYFAFVEILEGLDISTMQLGHLHFQQLHFLLSASLVLLEAITQTRHDGLELGPFGICRLLGALEGVIQSFYLLALFNGQGNQLLLFGNEGLSFIFEKTFHVFFLELGQLGNTFFFTDYPQLTSFSECLNFLKQCLLFLFY